MARPIDDEDQEKPLDPAVERVRRKLVRFVAINLGLLFVALMAVVAAIVYRANQAPEEPAVPAVAELPVVPDGRSLDGEIALPAGTELIDHSVSGGILSLHVRAADGARSILLYDLLERRLHGRVALVEEGG